MAKLADLISRSDWNDIQVELEREELVISPMMSMDYLYLYSKLLKMKPVSNSMRIIIAEIDMPEVVYDNEDDEGKLMLTIFGKNGMLNKNFELFRYQDEAEVQEAANAEAQFHLDLSPWEKWLGMDIDNKTLRERSLSNIVAVCMWGMTMESFEESDTQFQRERIEKMFREYEAMDPVERIDELTISSAALFEWEKYLRIW